MLDDGLLFEEHTLQRAKGHVEVGFSGPPSETSLTTLYQSGSAKALLPMTFGHEPHAVIINTAGGVTGGDRMEYCVRVEDGAHATATTQTAERIYKAAGGYGIIQNNLYLGAQTELHWLPQETILFDGAQMRRMLSVEMCENASFLAIEPLVLGRAAMGEVLTTGYFNDQWRIRRGGKLVYADALRFEGDLTAQLGRKSGFDSARALATIVYAAPDAEDRLEQVRTMLPEGAVDAAASAWNGLLVIRMIAAEARHLRSELVEFLTRFRGRDLPRVWHM